MYNMRQKTFLMVRDQFLFICSLFSAYTILLSCLECSNLRIYKNGENLKILPNEDFYKNQWEEY